MQRGLDAAARRRRRSSVQAFLSDPQVKSKLASLYLEPLAGSAEAIKQRAVTDAKVWGEFIKRRGIQNS